jgi:hypothetical protein
MAALHFNSSPTIATAHVHAATFLRDTALTNYTQSAEALAWSVANASACHDGTPKAAT